MKARRSIVGLGLVAALAIAGVAQSQAIPLVQQGRLFDADTDMPVDGTLNVTYTIFDAPQGGMQLWNESQMVVFSDGFFTSELGLTTPIDPMVLGGPNRFLEINVDGQALTPRSRIGAVPYALDAIGEIHPTSVHIQGVGEVINSAGEWTGAPFGSGTQAGYDIAQCGTLTSESTYVACDPTSGNNNNVAVQAGQTVAVFVSTAFYRSSGTLNRASIELTPCYRPAGTTGTPTVPGFEGRTNTIVPSSGSAEHGHASSAMVWNNIAAGNYDFLLCAKQSQYTSNSDVVALYSPKITVLQF